MTLAKKIFKKSLTVVLVMLMTLGAFTTLVDAKSIGGGGSVTVNTNKYTMTKKAIDAKTGTSIKATENEEHLKSGTEFKYTPDKITDYTYVGFYIEGVGSVNNLQTGNPTVQTKSNGSDCVNGKGAYTIVAVYKVDKNGNEIPDDEEKYNIREKFVTEDGTPIEIDNAYNLEGVVEYSKNAPSITNYVYVGYFYSAAKEGYKKGDLNNPVKENPAEFLLESTDGTNSYVVTFVYKITAQPITISYDKNSLTATGTMTKTDTYKGVATRLSQQMFNNPGYNFDGWATTTNGSAQYSNRESVTFTSDTTLYAVWSKDASLWATIKYDKNAADATGTMTSDEIVKNQRYVLKENEFDRPGYIFDGWSKTPGGTKDYNNKEEIFVAENVTLYAVWKEDASQWATITFDKNGTDVSGDMPDQRVVKGVATYLKARNFDRYGYIFEGWSTTPTGTVQYVDQAPINISSSITLYAVWTKDPTKWANIKFDINSTDPNAKGTMDSQDALIGSTLKLTKNDFKWLNDAGDDAEYVFLGWSTNPNAVQVEYTDAEIITVAGPMTLYAIWATPDLWADSKVTADKLDASIGEEINFSFSFGNYASPLSSTWHQAVIVIDFNEYVTGADKLVVTKNGTAITNLNYTYNYATRQIIIEIGDLKAGETIKVSWAGTVVETAQGKDIEVEYDVAGLVANPVLRGRSTFVTNRVSRLSGSTSIRVK